MAKSNGWKILNTNVSDETNVQEDRALVTQFLQSGKETIFRELYRRHTPKLYLFCLRLCAGNHHDAEDLVQEAWIRVITALPNFQWRAKLSSWIAGIALNCFREQHWKRREMADSTLLNVESHWDTTLDLEMSIRRLPDGCREIFLLHDLEGYTHGEIGAALNISPGTSKSQLFEARKKLRQWLHSVRS